MALAVYGKSHRLITICLLLLSMMICFKTYVLASDIFEKKKDVEYIETDVVGLSIQGKSFWHKLRLYDLDVVYDEDGNHYLPVIRLLEALELNYELEDEEIVIKFVDAAPARLDINQKKLKINKKYQSVVIIEGISDISLRYEAYLPLDTIAELFSLDINWDPYNYSYMAETKRYYPLWKTKERESLLATQTRELKQDLPERLPAAEPEEKVWGLDFIQTRGRLNYQPVDEHYPDRWVLDSLEQKFWGDLCLGRYKFDISQPAYAWNDDTDFADTSPFIRLNRAEWTKNVNRSRLWLGDSTFGLNDITFPTVQMTGVRFDSLLGLGSQKNQSQVQHSPRGRLQKQWRFEGVARIGSTVELYVNDRLLDSEEVYIALPENPDLGQYAFPEVSLAPGSLNTVQIVITDPDGIRTVREEKVLGTSTLLPKDELALLGSLGTNREYQEWSTKGFFSGARLLYGLSNSVTLGSTAAYQNEFYDPVYSADKYLDQDERDYPMQSSHAGAQISWQPFTKSLAVSDFSFVSAEDRQAEEYSDWGSRLDLHLFPTEKTTLHGRYFLYQPEFFDGGNRNLRDRKGYVLHTDLELHPALKLSGAYAQVEDNVQDQKDETLSADIAHAELRSDILPKTRLGLGMDHLDPDWEDQAKSLYFLELNSHLLPRLNVHAHHSIGDDVFLTDETHFFQGLRLPGISLWETRHTDVSLSSHISNLGTFRTNYRKTNTRERVSGIHSISSIWGRPVQLRTELGQDLASSHLFFEQRCNYRFSRSQGTNLGLLSRYENQEWQVGLFLTISELFSWDRMAFHRVEDKRISPNQGGIYGRIFVDANLNYQLDAKEPGLEGVQILFDERAITETGANGSYRLPISGETTARISLDPNTVPAIYDVVHGIQTAYQEQGRWTKIDLAVVPVHSITGKVLSEDANGNVQAVSGVRVLATSAAHKQQERLESITSGDASYYIDGVRPGKVVLSLDAETIPGQYVFLQTEKVVDVPASVEPECIKDVDFIGEKRK